MEIHGLGKQSPSHMDRALQLTLQEDTQPGADRAKTHTDSPHPGHLRWGEHGSSRHTSHRRGISS